MNLTRVDNTSSMLGCSLRSLALFFAHLHVNIYPSPSHFQWTRCHICMLTLSVLSSTVRDGCSCVHKQYLPLVPTTATGILQWVPAMSRELKKKRLIKKFTMKRDKRSVTLATHNQLLSTYRIQIWQ